MPLRMLPEAQVAVDIRSQQRRKLRRAHPLRSSNLYTGPAATSAMNDPRASTQPSPFSTVPAPTNTGRGAHIAISSCESTGRSFHPIGPAYFRKFPAIQ